MSKLFNTLSDVLTPYANKINAHTGAIAGLQGDISNLQDEVDNFTVTTDTTLTQAGMAADAKSVGDVIAEVNGSLTQQSEKIDAIGDMDEYNIYVTDWVMGRRSTGSTSNYYYSSNDIIPIPSQLYFDDANYKISYVQCNADGTENIGYGSSWKTTSPVTISKTGSYDYCWIEIQHTVTQTSITDSELEEVKANTYYVAPIPIVETIKQVLTSAYVDGVNGLDTNDGSSAHPYKTIGKAIESGRNTIFVANGTYNEFVFIQNREKLTILPWAYGLSFDPTVPDTPKIEITGGTCAIRAYDCGELKFVGIYGHDTVRSAFELLRNKSVEMINCWASDVDDPEWNGFKIASCNGVFRNCQAWNIGKDGFGISIYGNTQFIDCVAHDCGDDGVSHHDGCTGAVIGGEYYNCAKGGVASPTYGSYIDIINVYSHDNVYGLYSVTDSTRRRSKARISGCVFKNNTSKDIYINNNDIIGWNNIYDNKSLINQATFTEF